MKDDSSAVSEGLSLMQAVVTWCGPWRESEQHLGAALYMVEAASKKDSEPGM